MSRANATTLPHCLVPLSHTGQYRSIASVFFELVDARDTFAAADPILDELYRAKAALGPKAAQARLALFSRAGFSESVRKRADQERVTLVEVSDLFTSRDAEVPASP